MIAALIASAAPAVVLANEPAPQPAVDQRDFSAEAESARHPDRLEALRDPELRRHYIDQLESRRWSDLDRKTRLESKLTPGGGPPTIDLPPEIRHLQRSLGGSQVDKFPSLRDDGFAPPAPAPSANDRRSARPPQRDAIRALRDAATQLDSTANRLEQLDLYRQADALRHQAQQLRIDARGFGGDPQTTPTPSLSTPAVWQETPPPVLYQQAPRPEPMLQPEPAILPESAPQPTLVPVPTPTPAPEPQIPSDPPKPQPLNDAPTSQPSNLPELED